MSWGATLQGDLSGFIERRRSRRQFASFAEAQHPKLRIVQFGVRQHISQHLDRLVLSVIRQGERAEVAGHTHVRSQGQVRLHGFPR